ncbi:MAG: hypothetical protein V1915_01805 [Candidatus Bathyarchaeota archaeon]
MSTFAVKEFTRRVLKVASELKGYQTVLTDFNTVYSARLEELVNVPGPWRITPMRIVPWKELGL